MRRQQHIVIPSGDIQQVTPQDQRTQASRFREWLDQAQQDHTHVWVASILHRIDPPLDGAILSADTIVMPPMVGCFICEQEWAPDLNPVCPGDPQGGLI